MTSVRIVKNIPTSPSPEPEGKILHEVKDRRVAQKNQKVNRKDQEDVPPLQVFPDFTQGRTPDQGSSQAAQVFLQARPEEVEQNHPGDRQYGDGRVDAGFINGVPQQDLGQGRHNGIGDEGRDTYDAEPLAALLSGDEIYDQGHAG